MFHDFYYDLDRWELIRGTHDDHPITLIERIINFFDLSISLIEGKKQYLFRN